MKEKIIRLVQSAGEKTAVPEDDENLFDGGFLDSFQLADLVISLDSEFGITIPNEDMRPGKFATITKIVQYIEEKIA